MTIIYYSTSAGSVRNVSRLAGLSRRVSQPVGFETAHRPTLFRRVASVTNVDRNVRFRRRPVKSRTTEELSICGGQICPCATSWPGAALARVAIQGPLPRRRSVVLASNAIFTATSGVSGMRAGLADRPLAHPVCVASCAQPRGRVLRSAVAMTVPDRPKKKIT